MDCQYCDSDVEAHEPVFVAEGAIDADSMAFCNYACLTAFVDERGLTDDTCCHWSPDGESAD